MAVRRPAKGSGQFGEGQRLLRLSVLGAGNLGAIHATCMAHLGHEIKAFDVDSTKGAKLANGEPPFYEPGFNELLKSTLVAGRLLFTDTAQEAIRGAEMHFICEPRRGL